jgi:RNA polymerase sigma factor (sigma-70 family)
VDLIELAARCCRGEEAAWEAFLPSFQHIGLRSLRTFRLSRVDADEVLAEALASLYQGGLRTFRGETEGQLVSFLRRVVRNEAVDQLKARGPQHRGALPGEEQGPEGRASSHAEPPRALTTLEDEECLEFLRQEVERLKRDDRELFLMKARGLKEREMAEQTGRPPGTIAAQIARLLARLRQRLAERGCSD